MKAYVIAAGLFLVLPPAASAQQAPAGPPQVKSPEVSADRRVTFRLAAPKATEVKVTCECLKDPAVMQNDANGVWSVTIGPLEPEIYEYEFRMDGVQTIDPRNQAVKYNGRPSEI